MAIRVSKECDVMRAKTQIVVGLFGKATVIVGTGVFRIQINGAVEVGDCSVVIALASLARPRLL